MAMVKGRTIRFGITNLLHFQIKYQCHTTRTIIPLTRDGLGKRIILWYVMTKGMVVLAGG